MKLSLKKLRISIFLFTAALICGGIGFKLGTHQIKFKTQPGDWKTKLKSIEVVNRGAPVNKKLDFALFWEVWNKLEEKYLEKENIDRQTMFYGAIQGLTASLGDPYTVFLPPEDNKEAKEDLNGSFEGVGIRLGFKDDDKLAVIAPLKGMPAEAVGVRAGDLILHLRDENKDIDEDTIGISLPEAVKKIRGPRGTKIYFTLLHEGEEKPFEVGIVRKTIVVPSVDVDFLDAKNARREKRETLDVIDAKNAKTIGERGENTDEKIAHLKLMRFGELTLEQWKESITKIKNHKPEIKKVILDIRGNPGGYLSGSVNLASEFLSKGIIVKQEDYQGRIESYSVNRKGRLLNVSLIVLIDKGTASASEILAGALQDHQRAKLVGVQSFGKGVIQESEDLSSGAGLHITTAKWLTPNGTWINKTGLKPDIEVENDFDKPEEDKQLDKAVEMLFNF